MNPDSANSAGSPKPPARAYFAPRLKLPPAPVALSMVLRLGIAVILVSLAALLKLRIDPILGSHAPFLLFFTAVALSTWLGGLGAGLLSVLLSALFSLALSVLAPNEPQFTGNVPLLIADILPFVLESVSIVILIHQMRRAQSQSAARATALQQSEDRYRRVLDNAFEGIWIVDAQGRTTYCNAHMATLLGYSLEEIQGVPIFDFVLPEERTLAMERFRKRSEGLRARFETRLVRKDGSLIWVLVSSTPLFDDKSAFQGSMSMVADISERKRMEEVLRQSEERYRAFVRQSSEAIWRFEMDEPLDCSLATEAQIEHLLAHVYIAECNDAMAQMFDRENAEAMHNARLHEMVPINEASKDYLRTFVLAGHQLQNLAAQINDTQGRPRFYEISVFGIKENGLMRRLWCMSHDVTAQREAEMQRAALLEHEHEARVVAEKAHQEIQSASRAKDEFLATLSHELRTPLSSILGWSQLLVTEKMDDDTTKYALGAIERNAKLQAQLVEDLLDISRITMGRLHIEQAPTLINEVLKAAIETVTPAARAKNIDIEYSNECDDALQVRGDAQRLQQVAWNLLSNAIKFTPNGGRICVRQSCDATLAKDATRVKIEFSDNGIGIAPEFVPHAFEAFRQADSSSTRSHGGVGLGLSIVKTLVDLHAGSIEVRSQGERNGTTFIVELPIGEAKNDASHPIDEPQT